MLTLVVENTILVDSPMLSYKAPHISSTTQSYKALSMYVKTGKKPSVRIVTNDPFVFMQKHQLKTEINLKALNAKCSQCIAYGLGCPFHGHDRRGIVRAEIKDSH